jgi:hypothetical protein
VIFIFGVGSCLELCSKSRQAPDVDSDCETCLISLTKHVTMEVKREPPFKIQEEFLFIFIFVHVLDNHGTFSCFDISARD